MSLRYGAAVDARALDEEIAGAAAAHQRLLADADAWVDVDVTQPSLLPGWSVGHVLAHVARNADSMIRALAAAGRGESADRYPGGREQRAADIEAGAGRPLDEQVADVRQTIWTLEQTWARLPAEAWKMTASALGRPEPVADLPFRRWREVEVHHADLGFPEFTWDDWSDGYVRRELRRAEMAWSARRAMGLTDLPAAAQALPPNRRLAWLMGRLDIEGLPHVDQWW
jgi:maleylpyruvate isomerase